MRRLLWFFVGVLLAAGPMLAFAEDYPRQVTGYATPGTSNFWLTGDQACAALTQHATYPWRYAAHTETQFKCMRDGPAGGTNTLYGSIRYGCPYGGTYNSTLKICQSAPPCPEGQTRDAVTGECKAPPCTAGTSVTTRAWVGYAATQNNVADWINPTIPTTTCDGTCQAANLTITSGSCTVSTALGGPPYPGSCEFKGTATGQTCTTATGTAADAPPPIACPSGTYQGSVNGVSGCYGGYQGSESTTTTTNPDGSTTKVTTKTAPDGSTTKETTTTQPDGTTTRTKETITSTPAAGSGPLPGQGGTDTGTGGGGTGSGGAGGSGAGTGEKGDTEQADFCRDNPKSLMCQEVLKLDESGTPSSAPGVQEGFGAALEAVMQQAQFLEGMGWLRNGIPLVWNPAASLPGGACYAWDFGHGSIDPCPVADKIRAWWSFVIVFLAGLYAWHRATTVFKG